MGDLVNAQETLWSGVFGNQYAERNANDRGRIVANIALFTEILSRMAPISSFIEFGAGTGQNIAALRQLIPNASMFSVEINEQAAMQIPWGQVIKGSLFDCWLPQPQDLAFTKGLLIHISPADIKRAYERLWQASARYIVLCEYYNPEPICVRYRDQDAALWKRDFAGEMLDLYPTLRLVDYGFAYHRGVFPQDDLTWFLLEKR